MLDRHPYQKQNWQLYLWVKYKEKFNGLTQDYFQNFMKKISLWIKTNHISCAAQDNNKKETINKETSLLWVEQYYGHVIYLLFFQHLIIVRFKVSQNSGSDHEEIYKLTRLSLVKSKSSCNSMSQKKINKGIMCLPPLPAMGAFQTMYNFMYWYNEKNMIITNAL